MQNVLYIPILQEVETREKNSARACAQPTIHLSFSILEDAELKKLGLTLNFSLICVKYYRNTHPILSVKCSSTILHIIYRLRKSNNLMKPSKSVNENKFLLAAILFSMKLSLEEFNWTVEIINKLFMSLKLFKMCLNITHSLIYPIFS